MLLVLFVVAIVLLVLASISAVPSNKIVHLGWLGLAFLAAALLVGSGAV